MNNFIEKISEQFDESDISLFNADTDFKSLSEWSSLVALSIIAMIDDEYDIVIKGEDIRESVTIEDLYKRVMKLKGE